MTTTERSRRAPALGARILVASLSLGVTAGLVGWMGRSARASLEAEPVADEAAPTIRRVVVVPTPEPDIVLQAVVAGRTVTVVTAPPRVVRRAPAASGGGGGPAPVTSSRGS